MQSLERQYFSSRSNSNAYSGIPNKSWSSYSKYKKPYKFTQQYNKVTSKPMTKAEYLHHYQAYQYEKHNKNQQKPQKINKKSKNFILDPDFDRYQPTSPNPKRSKSPPKSRKKELYQNEEPNSPSKLEKPLIQYFFQKIPKAASHTNPSKSELLKFLIKNIQILELYNLDAETLNKELNEYSNNNFMSFEEFSHFLKSKKEKNNDQQIENTYLLDNKYLTRMKDIFNEVDSYKDGVVKLSLFIEKLRNDQKISKILEFQTLYLPAIDKTLTLNQVFKQMEQEAIIAKGEKNYITWEQFEKYFIEHKIKDKFLLSKVRILKAKNLITKTEGDDNTIDLDRHLKQLLKDTFDKTPKKKDSKKETTGFVKTFDLLENIRGNENFWKYERENVRKKGGSIFFIFFIKILHLINFIFYNFLYF